MVDPEPPPGLVDRRWLEGCVPVASCTGALLPTVMDVHSDSVRFFQDRSYPLLNTAVATRCHPVMVNRWIDVATVQWLRRTIQGSANDAGGAMQGV